MKNPIARLARNLQNRRTHDISCALPSLFMLLSWSNKIDRIGSDLLSKRSWGRFLSPVNHHSP